MKNRLIGLFVANHGKELYSQALKENMPFYEFDGWIKKQLNEALL